MVCTLVRVVFNRILLPTAVSILPNKLRLTPLSISNCSVYGTGISANVARATVKPQSRRYGCDLQRTKGRVRTACSRMRHQQRAACPFFLCSPAVLSLSSVRRLPLYKTPTACWFPLLCTRDACHCMGLRQRAGSPFFVFEPALLSSWARAIALWYTRHRPSAALSVEDLPSRVSHILARITSTSLQSPVQCCPC